MAELTEIERVIAAEASLKREYAEHYPSYDPRMFLYFKQAITKEAQGMLEKHRADVPLCCVAFVAVLTLLDAIKTGDLSKVF